MSYKIKLKAEAKLDIQETIAWYDEQQAKLGTRFYKTIQDTFKQLKENPYLNAIRYKNIRTAIVKKYPFMVHYFVNEDNKIVVVLAVFHTSSNPQIWKNRSDNI